MSDEFDEAAEIAKLRYSIRVLIVHPTLAPDEISDALNLNPDISHWVGQPRRTPQGRDRKQPDGQSEDGSGLRLAWAEEISFR